MKLYSFAHSSTSYRVRIALNLKGLKPEMAFVNLTKGEQRTAAYAAVNAQKIVPTLLDQGHALSQSLAIMEYLEEMYPYPPIMPKDPFARAHVRSLALAVACDISPLGNLKVRQYLTGQWHLSENATSEWIRHWIDDGFTALEALLAASPYTGIFCHGDSPTIADCCLMPQIFNAQRWKCDLMPYTNIRRIAEACEKLPAFADAHPSKQPDAG